MQLKSLLGPEVTVRSGNREAQIAGITAGLNAAPATARIIERIAPLGVLPRRVELRTPEPSPFDAPPAAQ